MVDSSSPSQSGAATETVVPAASPKRAWFVRSIHAADNLELFFVTAIATILIVRAALAATGWPQLGGGKIHVAHLLWGGLGMLIALVLFMVMKGRLWELLATLAAGIGFGLFIDELGKFITSDNDYFFQPAVAIIYLVFVVLFLVGRAIVGGARPSPQSALVNALGLAQEAIMRGLDETERNRALALLASCDEDDALVRDLTQTITSRGSSVKESPRLYPRLKSRLRTLYEALLRRRWFKWLVVGWFVLVAVVALLYPFATGAKLDTLDFWAAGQLTSAMVVGAFVVVGLLRWRRSRLAAYRWFERALLFTIFVYEFFAFYRHQVLAVFGLIAVLLTYAAIRLMIGEEESRTAR